MAEMILMMIILMMMMIMITNTNGDRGMEIFGAKT